MVSGAHIVLELFHGNCVFFFLEGEKDYPVYS